MLTFGPGGFVARLPRVQTRPYLDLTARLPYSVALVTGIGLAASSATLAEVRVETKPPAPQRSASMCSRFRNLRPIPKGVPVSLV